MYWGIKFTTIASGPNLGAEFPVIVGPFGTSEEQKAWARVECAEGRRAYWLDVKDGRPVVGRVSTWDELGDLMPIPPPPVLP
jgi:hypothetical protein